MGVNMKFTKTIVRLAARMFFYFIIISLIALTCTGIEKNKDKINHVQHMQKLFKKTSNTPYPNQNFLYMIQTLAVTVEGKEVEQLISTASGIAVKRDGKTVYGLTAGHWCDTNQEIKDNKEIQVSAPGLIEVKMKASFYGKVYEIEIVHSDSLYDICVVRFDSPYANKIKRISPAKKYPKIGERLYTVSAPLGMYHPYTRFHFDGYFAGCMSESVYCFYTIPGVEGSSGSGVLNKKGELVSILDISVIDFYQITGGAKLEIIKEMYILYLP